MQARSPFAAASARAVAGTNFTLDLELLNNLERFVSLGSASLTGLLASVSSPRMRSQESRNAEHMYSQTNSAARHAPGDALGLGRQGGGAQRTSNPNRGGDSGSNGSQMLQKRPPPDGQHPQASHNAYAGAHQNNGGNNSYGPPSPGSNYTSWSTAMPAELASLGLLPLPLAPSSEAHAGAAVALRGGPSVMGAYEAGTSSPIPGSQSSRQIGLHGNHTGLTPAPLPADPFEQQYSAAASPAGSAKLTPSLGTFQAHTQVYGNGSSPHMGASGLMNAHRGESAGAYSMNPTTRLGSHGLASSNSDRVSHLQAGGAALAQFSAQLAQTGVQGALAPQEARGRQQQSQQQQQYHQVESAQQSQPQAPTHTLLLRNSTGTSLSHPQQQFDTLSQATLGLHQLQQQAAAASAQQRGQQHGTQQQSQLLGVPHQSSLGNSGATTGGGQDNPRTRTLPLPDPQASFPALPWEYLDAEEVVQGPFDSSSLVRWFREGHFNSDVLVRAIGFYWTSLGLVITQLESRPPPTAAMHSTSAIAASAAIAAATAAATDAASRQSRAPVVAETAASAAPAAALPVSPEALTASAVSLFFCDHSPDLMWTYLDDSGSVQGGFSSSSMMDWFQGGYLRLEVPVMGAILPSEMKDRVTHVKAWYIPLGTLLTYVKDSACMYKPVKVEDARRGRPLAGWNGTAGPAGVASHPQLQPQLPSQVPQQSQHQQQPQQVDTSTRAAAPALQVAGGVGSSNASAPRANLRAIGVAGPGPDHRYGQVSGEHDHGHHQQQHGRITTSQVPGSSRMNGAGVMGRNGDVVDSMDTGYGGSSRQQQGRSQMDIHQRQPQQQQQAQAYQPQQPERLQRQQQPPQPSFDEPAHSNNNRFPPQQTGRDVAIRRGQDSAAAAVFAATAGTVGGGRGVTRGSGSAPYDLSSFVPVASQHGRDAPTGGGVQGSGQRNSNGRSQADTSIQSSRDGSAPTDRPSDGSTRALGNNRTVDQATGARMGARGASAVSGVASSAAPHTSSATVATGAPQQRERPAGGKAEPGGGGRVNERLATTPGTGTSAHPEAGSGRQGSAGNARQPSQQQPSQSTAAAPRVTKVPVTAAPVSRAPLHVASAALLTSGGSTGSRSSASPGQRETVSKDTAAAAPSAEPHIMDTCLASVTAATKGALRLPRQVSLERASSSSSSNPKTLSGKLSKMNDGGSVRASGDGKVAPLRQLAASAVSAPSSSTTQGPPALAHLAALAVAKSPRSQAQRPVPTFAPLNASATIQDEAHRDIAQVPSSASPRVKVSILGDLLVAGGTDESVSVRFSVQQQPEVQQQSATHQPEPEVQPELHSEVQPEAQQLNPITPGDDIDERSMAGTLEAEVACIDNNSITTTPPAIDTPSSNAAELVSGSETSSADFVDASCTDLADTSGPPSPSDTANASPEVTAALPTSPTELEQQLTEGVNYAAEEMHLSPPPCINIDNEVFAEVSSASGVSSDVHAVASLESDMPQATAVESEAPMEVHSQLEATDAVTAPSAMADWTGTTAQAEDLDTVSSKE